jgi:hypothetical protein
VACSKPWPIRNAPRTPTSPPTTPIPASPGGAHSLEQVSCHGVAPGRAQETESIPGVEPGGFVEGSDIGGRQHVPNHFSAPCGSPGAVAGGELALMIWRAAAEEHRAIDGACLIRRGRQAARKRSPTTPHGSLARRRPGHLCRCARRPPSGGLAQLHKADEETASSRRAFAGIVFTSGMVRGGPPPRPARASGLPAGLRSCRRRGPPVHRREGAPVDECDGRRFRHRTRPLSGLPSPRIARWTSSEAKARGGRSLTMEHPRQTSIAVAACIRPGRNGARAGGGARGGGTALGRWRRVVVIATERSDNNAAASARANRRPFSRRA